MATELNNFDPRPTMQENDDLHDTISSTIKRLLQSCLTGQCFEKLDSNPIPAQDSVETIIKLIRRIIFPGYFTQSVLAPNNLEYSLHQEVAALTKLLSEQICLSIQHHADSSGLSGLQCSEIGRKKALEFIHFLPRLRSLLSTDVQAGFQGDPAAKSHDEIIWSK